MERMNTEINLADWAENLSARQRLDLHFLPPSHRRTTSFKAAPMQNKCSYFSTNGP